MSSIARVFPVMEAGCDWLTMTANSTSGVSGLFDWADEAYGYAVDEGFDVRPWGFRGFTGTRCGQIALAHRGGTVLLVLSGESARAHFGAVVKYADNVSRFDAQVTVRAVDSGDAIIAGALQALARPGRSRGRRLKYTHIRDSLFGETLYVGSRSSDWYGRLYNKASQSGGAVYADCWRYEVELKRVQALDASRWVAQQSSQEAASTALVSYGYKRRGIDPYFDAGAIAVDMACSGVKTDDERRMTYLRRIIRPMVAKMLQRHTREDLRRVLGLSEELYLREVYRDGER